MPDVRVTIRLSPGQLAVLDDLAGDHGGSRSAALRALLDAAGGTGSSQAGGSGRMTEADVIEALEAGARAGSVPAARELLDRFEAERIAAITAEP